MSSYSKTFFFFLRGWVNSEFWAMLMMNKRKKNDFVFLVESIFLIFFLNINKNFGWLLGENSDKKKKNK